MDGWLTTPEVAEHLHVGVRTVHDWRQAGLGPPAYKVGRQLLWRLGDVDAWVQRQADAGDDGAASGEEPAAALIGGQGHGRRRASA